MDRRPPFGLPLLAEVPELTLVLQQLREVDRLLARAIDGLILLQDHSVAETATGVPLEQWLAAVARRTGADRRMLATATTVCRRLPSLHGAFRDGTVSWAQLRIIALRVIDLPTHLDERIDAEIGNAILGAADADPDALARVVTWALAAFEAVTDRPRATSAPESDWLALQPRLDGSGGQLHGDFGPDGFAILDAALDPGPPQAATHDGPGTDTDRHRAAGAARDVARGRADRLLRLCRAGHDPASDGEGPGLGRAPQVILRHDLDSLLGHARLPGHLLTHLSGGVMRVDAPTARRIADAYGADLRLVLVDHGRVVGVGRRTHRPPGWLADAVRAVHDTCSEPGCATAARVCDLDHARPWHADGATDVDNLAPLCARTNHTKEHHGWKAAQDPDGARTWHHPRSGLTTRTVPATWRPPPVGPPGDRRPDPPEPPPPDPPPAGEP